MKSLKLIGLLFIVILASCRNDIDETTTIIDKPVPPVIASFEQAIQEVTASVTGFVVDEDDQPIANAAISYPGGSMTTDDYGHFIIRNQKMNALSTVIQASKEGYFDGNRRFFPTANKMNRIKIALMKKNFDQSFQAATGGTLTFENGGQVIFASNSIKTTSGSPYTGEIWAAVKWMDPTALSTMDRMPGNLQGVSLENQEMALSTYGMIAVELEDPQGNALNLIDGQTAELRMPVPSSILANAPTFMPLWSFFPEYGLWAEESEATLENGFYVGNVSHFSFWNCDYPYELVNFTARLIDSDGNPISNMLAILELSNTSSGAAYSTSDGFISGKIPANEALTLKLYDICGAVVYVQVVGPFAADVNLGDIIVTNNTVNNTTVTGEIVDCDNNPVTNGLVIINLGNRSIYEYITTSTFDISFTTCQSTGDVRVVGIDLDALIQSDEANAPSGVTTDVGQLIACDIQLENYIQLTIEDSTYLVLLSYVGEDSISGNSGTILVAFAGNDHYVSFNFDGVTTGDYSTANSLYGIYFYNENIVIRDGSFDSFHVTQFDGDWEVVKGNFSGTLLNFAGGTATPVDVSGTFSWAQ